MLLLLLLLLHLGQHGTLNSTSNRAKRAAAGPAARYGHRLNLLLLQGALTPTG
jgi:hypothetical protein